MNLLAKQSISAIICLSLSSTTLASISESNQVEEQAKTVTDSHGHEEGESHGAEDSHGHEEGESHGAEDSHGHEEGESHGAEDSHGHEEGESHGAGGEVKLTPQQVTMAEIKVSKLLPKQVDYSLYAPGEIKANGYTSYSVSPRVDSVVMRRHAALGDHVKKGQPLVTLFSESIAIAQADYQKANSEWSRVQRLGRKTISDQRYVEAQTNFESSYGQLVAYGVSEEAIAALSNKSVKLGQYTLNAEISGAVLSDDFQQGQRVESGQALMKLANEDELWVEARLPSSIHINLKEGTLAEVKVDKFSFSAFVVQKAHVIDPNTRTRVVRLKIDNRSHRLHPGMFADVFFKFATLKPVLAVPESALMRSSDGDWTILIEESPGTFRQVEVILKRSLGSLREIEGVQPGLRFVLEGAFYVASEIAKGGFDPHNH